MSHTNCRFVSGSMACMLSHQKIQCFCYCSKSNGKPLPTPAQSVIPLNLTVTQSLQTNSWSQNQNVFPQTGRIPFRNLLFLLQSGHLPTTRQLSPKPDSCFLTIGRLLESEIYILKPDCYIPKSAGYFLKSAGFKFFCDAGRATIMNHTPAAGYVLR